MIATTKNEEYEVQTDGKVKCTKCGSVVNVSGYTKHKKTLKHLSDNLTIKSSDRHVQMRTITNQTREKQIEVIGLDQVREKERLKKQKQRADKKAGVIPRVRNIPVADNKKDATIDEFNQAKKDIDNTQGKKERLQLTQVINDARQQVSSGTKSLPEVKKLLKAKIVKVNECQSDIYNCEKLVDILDSKNLKNLNSSFKIERSTLQGYINQIGRIYKGLSGESWDCSNFTWLNATDVVIEYVENMSGSHGTKRNYLNSIYSILRRIEGYSHLTTEYNKAKTKYGDIVDEKRGQNKLNEKEAVNILPWGTIVKYNNPEWNEEAMLLFKLYTAMPPRRLKDYSLLKYIKGKSVPIVQKMDKEFNYIVVNKNNNPIALVINNYKTKKRYGQYNVDLTLSDAKPIFRFSEIRKAIKSFSKSTNIKSGELVFPNSQGGVYRDFTVWLHFLFKGTGKKISANLLRHAFISNFLSKNPNVSDNTIKKLAHSLGHKPETMRSYRKLDAPVESDEE